MKRLLCLLLTLSLIFVLGSVSLAAEGDQAQEPDATAAPAVNVDTATYGEQETVITDEDIAAGSTVEIKEEVPAAPAKLPKTGGIPAEAFYVAGALIIVAALVLSRVKTKAAPKN